MSNKYGPWATLIDAGGNPQLSAFWRRRLTMLVPASKTSPVLSRRNLLYLLAVGILTCVLPTFFFAPAAAEDKKPTDKATPENNLSYYQDSTDSDTPWFKNHPYVGGLPYYHQLQFEFVRKELKLTSEQEKKLREIAADFQAYSKRYNQEMEKEAKNLQLQQPPPKKMQVALAELQQKMKDVRKQIEELLTGEQMTLLKSFILQNDVFSLELNPQWYQKLVLSAEQKKELDRLFEESKIKTWQLGRNKTEKILGVLSPQQREKLNDITGSEIGTTFFHRPGGKISFTVYDALSMENIHQELNLTPENSRKLKAIFTKYSQMAAKELPKQEQGFPYITMIDDQRMKPERELQEIEKQMREEIDPILTPQQWATLKNITLDERAYRSLESSQILKEIGASKEQQKEFSRIHLETFETIFKSTYETGEKALRVLSPQQREKFEKEMNRVHNFSLTDASEIMSITPADNAKPDGAIMTKSDVGRMIINSNAFDNTFTTTVPFTVTGSISAEAPAKENTSGGSILVIGAPVGPAKESTSGVGTLNLTQSEYIALPAYSAIADPKIRKQLEISPQQEKKLREISAAFMVRQEKVGQELMNMPPKEREANSAEFKRKFEELRTNIRKQMEEVITPQQLDAYKKLTFPMMASGMLFDPEILKIIGVTPEQKKNLGQIPKDMFQSLDRESQANIDKCLALLSREQLEKLRAEVERRYPERHEPAVEKTDADNSTMGSTNTVTLTVNDDSDTVNFDLDGYAADFEPKADYMILPVYENLGSETVRKTLGLNADQVKRLREIASDSQARHRKFSRELQNLAPDEQRRKLREFQQESAKMAKEIRQKIEALLTPEQLAKLKDNQFHAQAFALLINPQVQEKIGLSDRQKAEINRIPQDMREKSERLLQEMFEKELGILTPGQQEKLHEELDRRGW